MFPLCKKNIANLIYFLKCFYDAHLELFWYNSPGGSPTHKCVQETSLCLLLRSRHYDVMIFFVSLTQRRPVLFCYPLNEELPISIWCSNSFGTCRLGVLILLIFTMDICWISMIIKPLLWSSRILNKIFHWACEWVSVCWIYFESTAIEGMT